MLMARGAVRVLAPTRCMAGLVLLLTVWGALGVPTGELASVQRASFRDPPTAPQTEETRPTRLAKEIVVESNASPLAAQLQPKDGVTQLAQQFVNVKIYIYDLPPRFNKDWVGKPHTNNEMVEFEEHMEHMIRHSKFFTDKKDEATHFYIPVYAVSYCAVHKARENSFGCERSRDLVNDAIEFVKTHHHETWSRHNGADHLIASGYDWGACYATFEKQARAWGRPKELGEVRVIGFLGLDGQSGERNPGGCYSERDIIMPPYVASATRKLLEPSSTQSVRNTRVFFRGRSDNADSRTNILATFAGDNKAVVSDQPVPIEQFTAEMKRSEFCLVPRGFAPWSFRLSEAVLGGCVPVISDARFMKFGCDAQTNYNSFALMVQDDSAEGMRAAINRAEANSSQMAQLEMQLKLARPFFEYGDQTLGCLVSQLR